MKYKQIIIAVFLMILFGGCASAWMPKYTADSVNEMLSELNKKLPTIASFSVVPGEEQKLAGYYANLGSSTNIPGLSGSKLYLFPDMTYIYIQWADIMPPTIYAKGNWEYEKGFVIIQSDGSLPKSEFPKDHTYLPLILNKGKKNTLLLMGNNWNYSYFIEKAETNDQDMLFICSLEKEKTISENEISKLKKELMDESWNPEWFKN